MYLKIVIYKIDSSSILKPQSRISEYVGNDNIQYMYLVYDVMRMSVIGNDLSIWTTLSRPIYPEYTKNTYCRWIHYLKANGKKESS